MWSVVERPLNYLMIKVSDRGIAYALEHESASVDEGPRDIDTHNVLLEKKSHEIIVIHPVYVQDKNLFIHGCTSTSIYVFGVVENLVISTCWNTTLFVAGVRGTVSVIKADGLKFSGACHSFVVPPPTKGLLSDVIVHAGMSKGITACIHTNTPPLISNQAFAPGELLLAPLDIWYDGMIHDIKGVVDLSHNSFDQPRGLTTQQASLDSIAELLPLDPALYSLMHPTKFSLTPAPFTVSIHSPCNDSPVLMEALPERYRVWCESVATITKETRSILDKMKERITKEQHEALLERIQAEFTAWMKTSGQYVTFNHLVKMFIELDDDEQLSVD